MSVILNSKNTGFTLIEVMVAALILAIGILGLTTTMLLSLKSDQSSYFRSQASAMAYDMADRIRMNSNADYSNVDTDNAMPSDPQCDTDAAGCNANQLVSLDTREWALNFLNVDDDIASFSPKLPNGRGQIVRDAANRYVITVTWSEKDWDPDDLSTRTDSTQSLIVRMTP